MQFVDPSEGVEERVVEDLKEGLEIALFNKGIEVSPYTDNFQLVAANPDLVWIDKLVYKAITGIQKEELPITYSWFRYGPAAPLNTIKPENIHPNEIEFYKNSAYINRVSSYPTPNEFSKFFENLIESENYFETELYDFLLTFYREEAPEPFRNLYIANLKIQQVLYDLSVMSRQNTTNIDAFLPMIRTRFEEAATDLEFMLNSKNEFGISNDSISYLLRFIDLFEEFILELSSQNREPDHESKLIAQNLWGTYHAQLWKWISHQISNITIDEKKPQASSIKSVNTDIIREKDEAVPSEINDLEETIYTRTAGQQVTSPIQVTEGLQTALAGLEQEVFDSIITVPKNNGQ